MPAQDQFRHSNEKHAIQNDADKEQDLEDTTDSKGRVPDHYLHKHVHEVLDFDIKESRDSKDFKSAVNAEDSVNLTQTEFQPDMSLNDTHNVAQTILDEMNMDKSGPEEEENKLN